MADFLRGPSCRKPRDYYGGIVIVGGGLAAARTAEQLRRAEYAGAITIVSDEEHLPYDRPPLSKEVLRAEADDVLLQPAAFYDENDITVRLGSGVTTLDTAAKTVTLANGDVVSYDELIIATGLVPKRIPSLPDLEGIRGAADLRRQHRHARACGLRVAGRDHRCWFHRLRGGGEPAQARCRGDDRGTAADAAGVGAR